MINVYTARYGALLDLSDDDDDGGGGGGASAGGGGMTANVEQYDCQPAA